MNGKTDCRIEIEAAKALVNWKSLFANEVVTVARRLATESGESNLVTVSHYRQAAQIAVRTLLSAISDGEPFRDTQRAA